MLWLNKKSIKNILLNEYIETLKQEFCIRKILHYSKKSCVCLTSKNTIVKILNPDLSKFQFKNLTCANVLFSRCGIKIPSNLSIKIINNFYIIESEYINSKLFLNRRSPEEADRVFFNLFNKLFKISDSCFGPLIKQRKFLPPAFININRNYLQYWDNLLNHFLKKILDINFLNNVKKHYGLLRKKIKSPQQFILSHSDISPKHIFIYKSKIGCVDLEETMYLDASFMWAIWYVRTIHERKNKLDKIFFNKFVSRNLDFDLFIFHVYRELLIQYYYEKSLNNFFRDYSKILKNIQSILDVDEYFSPLTFLEKRV
ncbi:MAG: hypothetical protein AB1472_04735 [Candidatus Omnitrophota bacterium]